MNSNNKTIRFIFRVLIATLLPLFFSIYWFTSSSDGSISPKNEFLLLVYGRITNGSIIKVLEFEDYSEPEEKRSIQTIQAYKFFVYNYNFSPNEKTYIYDSASEYGEIPRYLKNVKIKPFEVNVKFLPNNPRINVVLNFYKPSFIFWLKRVLIAFIFLLIYIYLFTYYFVEWQNEFLNDPIISTPTIKLIKVFNSIFLILTVVIIGIISFVLS
jgi:hypothetical protein